MGMENPTGGGLLYNMLGMWESYGRGLLYKIMGMANFKKFPSIALWEPYILRRVDQLDTMVFGHFKYAARHFMTSK